MVKYFLAASVISIAAVGAAQATTYKCEMKPTGVIADVIYVTEEGDKVEVYDGVIHDVFDAPIAGKIATKNDVRVTYSWTVKGLKGTSNNAMEKVMPTLAYRLTRKLGNNKATVSVKAVGYVNSFRSTGVCKVSK